MKLLKAFTGKKTKWLYFLSGSCLVTANDATGKSTTVHGNHLLRVTYKLQLYQGSVDFAKGQVNFESMKTAEVSLHSAAKFIALGSKIFFCFPLATTRLFCGIRYKNGQ